jgi:S1-C subfamily serine protease
LRRATAAAVLCLALVATALLGGCGSGSATPGGGGDSSGGDSTSAPSETAGTATGATTPQPEVAIETAASGFDAAQVYKEASPGVVTIRSVFGPGSAAEGSGFVLDEEGHIVTNAHVVTDESGGPRKPAEEVFIEFPDRNVVEAEIVGFDPFADVALLKVEPGDFQLHPLTEGDDATLEVGESVAAIGSPFGETQSLSVGVISATERSVKSLTEFQIEGAIQTDAAINPGNSGGPLLNGAAEVVGINQQIETNSGANDGVGFAVPMTAIKRSVAQLMETGTAEYAYIGVSTQALYPQLAEHLGIDSTFGGLIADVVPGGPADEAGLQGGDKEIEFQASSYKIDGDVILQVEGHNVVSPNDLARYVSEKKPGEKVGLTILRKGKKEDVSVTLGKRPDSPEPE